MPAIDDIIEVESNLKLGILKKRTSKKGDPTRDDPAEPIDASGLPNRFPKAKPAAQLLENHPLRKLIVDHAGLLEPDELQSIQADRMFDHMELLNVWGRYKHYPG